MKLNLELIALLIISLVSLKVNSQEIYLEKVSFDSPEHDYSPVFYKDGIVFCTTREKRQFINMDEGIYYTDLYFVKIEDNGFGDPQPFLGKIKSRLNDGPGVFNETEDEFIYTSNVNAVSSTNSASLGLFITEKKNGEWQRRSSFDYNTKDLIVAHPALSPDGNMLVFAANMEGSKGGSIDLYYCFREGRYWSNPINLGKAINTRGREKFPVFQEDGKLYYSTDGFKNCEKMDIFYTEFIDGKWLPPTKLGAPYNSEEDDFGYIYSSKHNLAFVCSARENGIDEIFQVKQKNELELDYSYLDYIMVMMDIEEETKVNIYGYSYESSDPVKCQEKTAQLQKLATDYLMSKGADMGRVSVKNLGSSANYDGVKEGTFLTYEAVYETTTSFISNKQLAVNK